MNCKAILAVALAALVAIQFAGAHPVAKRSCACALTGTDVCGGPGGYPAGCMLRPARLRTPVAHQRVIYQKFAPTEFKPTNVCTCEGGVVTAPEIPRVACKVHGGAQAPNYAVAGSSGLALFGGSDDGCGDAPVNPCEENFEAPAAIKTYVIPSDNGPEEIVEEIQTPAQQAPVAADAVSLALAYDLATKSQKNILEENLAFGHMQTPKDGRVVIKKRIVPESGLYAVRNQIVELKAPSGFGRSCDDEAEAALIAAQQQASCGEVEESSYGGSLPSYRDLGFAPVNGECKFVPGTYQPSPQVVQTVEYSVPAPAPVAEGPSYGPCDALASLDTRGRGSSGYDYYSSEALASAAEHAAAQEAAAPACEDESSSYSAGLSYAAPAPRVQIRKPAHSGRPGCSCGCGY